MSELKNLCPVDWEKVPVWANFITVDCYGILQVWEWRPEQVRGKFWVSSNRSTKTAHMLDVNTEKEVNIWKRPDKQK